MLSAPSEKVSNNLILSRRRMMYSVLSSWSLLTPWSPYPLKGWVVTNTKIVDQNTKYTEVFLTKGRTVTMKYLKLFNRGLDCYPCSLGSSQGGQKDGVTSSALKRYCRDTDINLEFGSNTPQQIGENERVGRTIAVVVRCLLEVRVYPNFIGES